MIPLKTFEPFLSIVDSYWVWAWAPNPSRNNAIIPVRSFFILILVDGKCKRVCSIDEKRSVKVAGIGKIGGIWLQVGLQLQEKSPDFFQRLDHGKFFICLFILFQIFLRAFNSEFTAA